MVKIFLFITLLLSIQFCYAQPTEAVKNTTDDFYSLGFHGNKKARVQFDPMGEGNPCVAFLQEYEPSGSYPTCVALYSKDISIFPSKLVERICGTENPWAYFVIDYEVTSACKDCLSGGDVRILKAEQFFPPPILPTDEDIFFDKLLNVTTGITKEKLLSILGTEPVKALNGEMVNCPFKTKTKLINGKKFEIVYYYAFDYSDRNKIINENELIPFVFKDNILKGWGIDYLKKISDEL